MSRPSLVVLAANHLRRERSNGAAVDALQWWKEIDHIDLAVRVGSRYLKGNASDGHVVAARQFPAVDEKPKLAGILNGFPLEVQAVEILLVRDRKLKFAAEGRNGATLSRVLGHCCEAFNFVLLKVYFLIGLDWFRLPARKVFVELELIGRLPDEFKDLPTCENRRVNYTAFLVDSNDVSFCVWNGPPAACIFFDINFVENNFRRSILGWFSFTHKGDLRGSTESIP